MKNLLYSMFLFLAIPSIAWALPKQGIIIRIVDGDTLNIKIGNKEERVRLIGIDTPEKAENKKALRDSSRSRTSVATIIEQGGRASAHLASLLHRGDKVTVETDIEPRDKYQRLLAYVFLPNGTMLNDKMVADGYAGLLTYPPNVKYADRLLKSYRYARETKRGLWADTER